MASETGYLEVTTMVPSQDVASAIAMALIERQLAGCVQITGPVTSIYRWEGEIETAKEYRLTIKTTQAAYGSMLAAILELHPYDVPEVLALSISDGHADYLEWLDKHVGPPG